MLGLTGSFSMEGKDGIDGKRYMVGIDLNSETFDVALISADLKKHRVLRNRKLETPQDKKYQRLIGKTAEKKHQQFFSDFMRVIGKNLSDIKSDPALDSFLMKDPNTKLLHVHVPGFEKECQFTPTHVLAMMLSDFRAMAQEAIDMDATINEFCIGIPGYFTDSQKMVVRQAAKIAGLKVILFSATTAIAYTHALLEKSSDKKERKVAFIDVSHASMQVCIVLLDKETGPVEDPNAMRILEVLSHTYDHSLGEKDFLDTLLGHFQKDHHSNDELQKLCKKLKKQTWKQDLSGKMEFDGKEITEEELKCVCDPLLHKMEALLQDAINQDEKEFNDVFVTGSGSLIPAIRYCVQKMFKMAPNTLHNGVAQGCAFYCASWAIQSEEFETVADGLTIQKRDDLLDWQVVDNRLLSIKDERTKVSVAETVDVSVESPDEKSVYADSGRFELTFKEIDDARNKEIKMLLPKIMEENIYRMKKLCHFLNAEEYSNLDLSKFLLLDEQVKQYLKDVLDGGGVDAQNEYCSIREHNLQPIIRCFTERKNGHENKKMKSDSLRSFINVHLKHFTSNALKYSGIPQPAKNEFETVCNDTLQWLKDTIAAEERKQLEVTSADELKKHPQAYVPASFVAELDEKIGALKEAWKNALKEWKPEIEKLRYNILQDSYPDFIRKFRHTLLDPDAVDILGCFLLPLQIECANVPLKWIHLLLQGRKEEHATFHVKKHNAYNIGFTNMIGQAYEMSAGFKDGEYIPSTIPNAKYLDFNFDYISMLKDENGRETHEILEFVRGFIIDIEKLLDAVHVAAYHGCADHKGCELCSIPRAIQLAIARISFTLNEPARMRGIETAVYSGDRFLGRAFTDILMQAIWNWREMSEVLRRYARDRPKNVVTVVPTKLQEIVGLTTVEAVALFLYLILNRNVNNDDIPNPPQKDSGSSSRPPSSSDEHAADDGDNNQKPPPSPPAPGDGDDKENERQEPPMKGKQHGETLLHIFHILYESNDMMHSEPDDMMCIVVHERRGKHVIYSRKEDRFGALAFGSRACIRSLDLCGPSIAISPEAEAGCFLEFFRRSDKCIGTDEISVKVRLNQGRYYNHYRVQKFKLDNDFSMVGYAILTGAVEANIEISLRLPPVGFRKTDSNLGINGHFDFHHHLYARYPATKLETRTYAKHPIMSRQPVSGCPVALSKYSAFSPHPGGYVSTPKNLGLLDLVRSTTISLFLSRSVMPVKLGSEIGIDGILSIEGHGDIDIWHQLNIPNEVDISKNVGTGWIPSKLLPGLDYQVKLNLMNTKLLCP
ncbi:hypothetical protein ZWY2020_014924 [Hordeum vulgare]|nr:hypothetical protein ZWY2020_014924 [Hordeum vulgare]